MPTLAGPAVDPTLRTPARVWTSSTVLDEPMPPEPPVTPGDPDEPWTPPVATEAPQVRVVLGWAITRQIIGELTTAQVDDYDRDVELLAGYTASITAASNDPLWSLAAVASQIGSTGSPTYEIDPKRFVVWIYEDDVCVWTGTFRQPVDIDGGRVALPAQGPQVVFTERILGSAEQVDLLEDRGSFEDYASVAAMVADGWRFPDGVEAELVTDGVRGTKALRVRGGGLDGWVSSPKVTVVGAQGYGREVVGSAFGKWNENVPSGSVMVRTRVQRTDSLVLTNETFSDEHSGARPDDEDGWTKAPVLSVARMAPYAIPHRAWVEVRSIDTYWSYYDLATLRQGVQTGFPPGTNRDLAEYVDRIHRDLVAVSQGGSPTGLSVRVVSLTGVLASMRWSHSDRAPVSDVLSIVLDADGGPECLVTPGWNLEVHGEGLGSDRDDIALQPHDCFDVSWQIDPGAQVDDFVVDTGRGDGATWLSATVSQPYRSDRWRTINIVQGPNDRTLNEIGSWAAAHARAAARLQVTAEVKVPRWLTRHIALGDSLVCHLEDGLLGSSRRFRVLRIRHHPGLGLATLTLGAHDA